MKISEIQQKIETKRQQVEELKTVSTGEKTLEEINKLEEEIKVHLAELDASKIEGEIEVIDKAVPLKEVIENAVRGEVGLDAEEGVIVQEAQEIAQSLEGEESEELLVKKYQELISGLSEEGLDEREEEAFKKTKEVFEQRLREREKYDWALSSEVRTLIQIMDRRPGNVAFKKALVGDFPETLVPHDLEKVVNQIAYEDESFLSSPELYNVKKYVITKSLKDGELLKSPLQKIDRYEKKRPYVKSGTEDSWDDYSIEKRNAGNGELIKVDLDHLRRNPEFLNEIKEGDKEELKEVFLKVLASHDAFPAGEQTEQGRKEITDSSSVNTIAEELGVSKEVVDECVFHGLLENIQRAKVPVREYFVSFPESAKMLNATVSDSEKRGEIIQGIVDKGRKGRIVPRQWNNVAGFLGATHEERLIFLESFADCSEKDTYDVEHTLFDVLAKDRADRSGLSEKEVQFIFEKISSEEKVKLLARKLDSNYGAERVNHLPFTRDEVEQGLIQRFANRGIHTDVHDNDINYALKNAEDNFKTEFSKEAILEKVFKQQIFNATGNGIHVDSIFAHVERKKLQFTPEEIGQRKEDITQLYKTLIQGGHAYGFRDAEKLKEIFGPLQHYVSDAEIYQAITSKFLESPKDERSKDLANSFFDFQQASEYIPKAYKLSMLTNPEIQAKVGKIYEDYLSVGDYWRNETTSKNIGFFISKAETYEQAETQAFEQVVNKNDVPSLYGLIRKVNLQHPESMIIPKLKQYVADQFDTFIQKTENLSTLQHFEEFIPGSREKVFQHAESVLSTLGPAPTLANEDIRNLFSIKYDPDGRGGYYGYSDKFERYTRFFKETKSFTFFNRIESQYRTYSGGSWDGLYEKMGSFDEQTAEAHIAVLSSLTQKRMMPWEECVSLCNEKGLQDMAQLGTAVDELNKTHGFGITVDLFQGKFDTLVGLDREAQKERLIMQRSESLVRSGNYEETLRILEVSNIPQEKVMDAVFQQASHLMTKKDYGGLGRIWDKFPGLKEKFNVESAHDLFIHNAQAELGQSATENIDVKSKRLGQMKQAFWVNERLDRLPEAVQEKVKSFNELYGNKGPHLIALAIATYGLEDERIFLEKIDTIEKVLALHHPENIPSGMGVSCGIEYEVGPSVGDQYKKESHLGYRADMSMLNECADIKAGGAGGSAIHEIATRPTTNPYLLIAEVKMLQDCGMLDFNFQKYPDASRGYHLSLGGDSGLNARTSDMRFLYNALTLTGCEGLLVGREVNSVKSIHSKTLESVGHNQRGERVEFKGMGGDTFEQFERTVFTAYHAGIATQIQEKYTKGRSNAQESYAVSLPDSIDKFEEFLELLPGVSITQQEKEIVFEWMKFKKEMVLAVEQHNESFIESEFYGSLLTADGEYKELNLDDNYATKRLRYFGNERIDIPKEKGKYKIPENLFGEMTPEFVNAITRTNNLLVFKQPVLSKDKFDEKGRVKFNSNVYAFQTEMNNEGYQKGVEGTPYTSIFDRNGEMRNGYYPIQGTSEEMITHKSQILLNRFNKKMEELLRNPPASPVLQSEKNYETA